MSGSVRTIPQLLSEFAGLTAGSITAADEQDFIATMQSLTNNTLIPNIQSASYTFQLVDIAQGVLMNVGTANTLTIAPNNVIAMPLNQILLFGQIGVGVTTLVGAAGVTVNNADGLAMRARYTLGTAWQYALNTWLVSLS